jgi:hypothetical protein
MPAPLLRPTPVRENDALMRVLEASIETLKAENEILPARRRRDAGGAGLERRMLDKLNSYRRAGESYSDVIFAAGRERGGRGA